MACVPGRALAQSAKVIHNVNLRPEPSTEYPPIRLLMTSEPPLTLLGPAPEYGYYHVKTSDGEEAQVDGVRHEGDGDTRGWLKVDPEVQSLINAGKTSDEEGSLVFELV